jgi:hypothetical protein
MEHGMARESWFNDRWRPAMAWLWFAVSVCDFIVFPVLNALAAGAKLIPYQPWDPLTLKGGGLFHMAMGAVVGVAVYQSTQERLAAYSNNFRGYGAGSMTESVPPTPSPVKSSRAD